MAKSAKRPEMDAVFTMAPPPRLSSSGRARLVARKTLVSPMLMTCAHTWSSSSPVKASRLCPGGSGGCPKALLCRISRPPNASTAPPTMASMPAGVPASNHIAPPLVVRGRGSGRESTTNAGRGFLDLETPNGATSLGRSRARGGRHGEKRDGADGGGHEGGGDDGTAPGSLRRAAGGGRRRRRPVARRDAAGRHRRLKALQRSAVRRTTTVA